MTWKSTTDDDFDPKAANVADKIYDGLMEWGAGQADMTGRDPDDNPIFTVTVAQEPSAPSSTVAIHVDWRKQTVTTAWLERDEADFEVLLPSLVRAYESA